MSDHPPGETMHCCGARYGEPHRASCGSLLSAAPVSPREASPQREYLDYADILVLCDEFNIRDTDTMKHQLEDYERWRKDILAGRLIEPPREAPAARAQEIEAKASRWLERAEDNLLGWDNLPAIPTALVKDMLAELASLRARLAETAHARDTLRATLRQVRELPARWLDRASTDPQFSNEIWKRVTQRQCAAELDAVLAALPEGDAQ